MRSLHAPGRTRTSFDEPNLSALVIAATRQRGGNDSVQPSSKPGPADRGSARAHDRDGSPASEVSAGAGSGVGAGQTIESTGDP